MKLSENFELDEFLRSEAAARAGRKIEPTQDVVTNLERLCALVLEPLRVSVGRPITVLSGYRPLWLNQMIGGSVKSEHLDGRAADIIVSGLTPEQVCRRIATLDLPFNQVILEFDTWCHVSVCPIGGSPGRELLTASKRAGRTHYEVGIMRAA